MAPAVAEALNCCITTDIPLDCRMCGKDSKLLPSQASLLLEARSLFLEVLSKVAWALATAFAAN